MSSAGEIEHLCTSQEERLEYERLLQAALADKNADAKLYEQRLGSLKGGVPVIISPTQQCHDTLGHIKMKTIQN